MGVEKIMYFHAWFVTKYRKITLEGEINRFVKNILSECIKGHNYNVLEFETNKDHVHMLVKAKDRSELVGIVRTLKAISAREVLRDSRFYMGNNRHFWAKRYGSRAIAEGEVQNIAEYIRNQRRIPHTEVCGCTKAIRTPHASAWGIRGVK